MHNIKNRDEISVVPLCLIDIINSLTYNAYAILATMSSLIRLLSAVQQSESL